MYLIRKSLISILSLVVLAACATGPKQFHSGEYDDPTKVRLLDDRFNEADMQQMASTVVKAMVACPYVKNAPKPPVTIVTRVQNRTEEHIDMKMLTNKVRTSLIKTRKVRFVAKEQREALEEEYAYNEAGYVSGPTQKKRGKQIGADYLMHGTLTTNVQQVGDSKLVYYKLTMEMTNLDTSIIDCVEEREIRKKFKRQSVGI